MPSRAGTLIKGLLVSVFAVAIFFACKYFGRPEYRCLDCNVILVSIDTLRRDHLSAYGYSRLTSPSVAEFRDDAVFFDQAIAQAPSTAPSHASLFTSLVPSRHGASVSKKKAIRSDVKTMAEIMKEHGYQTASFNGGAQMNAVFGLGRGFDIYRSFEGGDYTQERFKDRVSEGIEWLERNKGNKFFLFLHSYDVHNPYSPEVRYLDEFKDSDYAGEVKIPIDSTFLYSVNRRRRVISEADRRFIVSAYDGEIRGVDDGIRELLTYLRRVGLYDNTIIVFTSDHGEEFNEHGWMGWHSHTLYDELLRVPLAIKFPKQHFAGSEVATQVRSIDVLPTLLDVLGIDSLPNFQGRSLTRLASGRGDDDFPEYAVSERESRGKLPTSVRSAKWKLHGKRLYDLENDPGETKNVADAHPEIVDQLKAIRKDVVGRYERDREKDEDGDKQDNSEEHSEQQ